MKKDAYYFPHYSNARNDAKIIKLRRVLGLEGYAIYFMLLEVLRDQTEFKYPINGIDDLSFEWHISKEKIQSVISQFDLFQIDEFNFFSTKLVFYLQPYLEKSHRASEAANKRWQNARNQIDTIKVIDANVDANALQMQSASNASKGEESKVKDISEIFNFKKCFLNIGVTENVLSDWLLVRKNKKATNSETAANDILKQISISGLTANECIKFAASNSWSSFKKEWYDNANKNAPPPNSDLCQEIKEVIKKYPNGKWVDDIYIVDNAHRWKKNGFKLLYQ